MPTPALDPALLEEAARLVRIEGLSQRAAAKKMGVGQGTLSQYLREGPAEPRKTKLPTDAISREEMLEQELNELRSATQKQRKMSVLEERILARLESGIEAAKPRYSPLSIPKARHDEHEFALLFSDTHASEVVSREETLGMNEYDWGIMLDRMARLQRAVLSYQQNRPYPIRKLHVWMLGDMLSGDIHQELAETNDRTT